MSEGVHRIQREETALHKTRRCGREPPAVGVSEHMEWEKAGGLVRGQITQELELCAAGMGSCRRLHSKSETLLDFSCSCLYTDRELESTDNPKMKYNMTEAFSDYFAQRGLICLLLVMSLPLFLYVPPFSSMNVIAIFFGA